MNPPQVYMCSHPELSSLLPPHTLPLGRPSALAPSIQVSMYMISDLKFLSCKSSIWTIGHAFLFLHISCNSFVETWTF